MNIYERNEHEREMERDKLKAAEHARGPGFDSRTSPQSVRFEQSTHIGPNHNSLLF